MVNPFKEVNWNPGTPERRKFAQSLVIGFPCVAALMLLMGRYASGAWNVKPSLWVGGVGVAVGLILWAAPAIAKPFYVAWYFIGCCVGIVVTNVLLVATYYLIMTSVGLLMRALGRAPIQKSFDRNAKTYWQDAPPATDAGRYYSQF